MLLKKPLEELKEALAKEHKTEVDITVRLT
jgi:hypothetical protein